MALRLNGSTGFVALEAPTSAGSNTISLPTSNGSANQYLKNGSTAGTLEFADLGDVGKVLQVIQDIKTDTSSHQSSSASFNTISGLSVTITPSSTSSKILIIDRLSTASASGQRYGIVPARGGSIITAAQADSAGSRTRVTTMVQGLGGNQPTEIGFVYLDSPGSTSALTYTVQCSAEGSQTVYVNRSETDTDNSAIYRGASTLTCIEVGP